LRHLLVLTALALAARTAAGQAAPTTPAEQAREEIEHPVFTAAGVKFASDMITHHAQAILICGWAPSHGASASVKDLCQRISVTQVDEISYMKHWLADRHQPVPSTDQGGQMQDMPGMTMPGMPGMLSRDQLATLDHAHGAAFDRLLLTDMIHHHQGAITMVNDLVANAHDEDEGLLTYASNVAADQDAEIGLMQRRLAAMPTPTP
jgi:uncharacterized protein (DUF305 family)